MVYEDGDDYEESFGEAVTDILISSARFLGSMRFSRQDEYEADNTAFDILVNSNVMTLELYKHFWKNCGH